MTTRIYNRTDQVDKRRDLRRTSTQAECLLWRVLRGRQVAGLKFRRQYSVGPYVLDFCCPELHLAIELDGPNHDDDRAERYDANRQANIESLGFRFLRFLNDQVTADLPGIVDAIVAEAARLRETQPHPNPSP